MEFKPFKHQEQGIEHIKNVKNAALFDEMGIGKTFQVTRAACELWEQGEIDTLVVVAPAGVRGVWDDPQTGELSKFCTVPYRTLRFDARCKYTRLRPRSETETLTCVIVSYAYIRSTSKKRSKLDKLLRLLTGHRYMVVFDESSAIKSHKSQQTYAAIELSEYATRRIILNGTPIANNITDLWAQMRVLDWSYVNHMNFYHFRAKYAKMGGYMNKQIVGIKEDKVQELQLQLKPYVIRRLKKHCLDLPDKLYTYVEVPMPQPTYNNYVEMKNLLVTFLEKNPSVAMHGGVKITRLSQLTSGLLGGIQDAEDEFKVKEEPERIDYAKIDAFLEWLEDKEMPIIVWSRFRAEILDLYNKLAQTKFTCETVLGGQSDKKRQEIVNNFKEGKLDIIIGQPHAGGLGLTLTRASTVVYLSNDYSLIARLQSEDRAHRPGQKHNVTYVDFLSTTPNGQKTIDHAVLHKLRNKEDLVSCSTKEWIKILKSSE